MTREALTEELSRLDVDPIRKSGDKYAQFPYVTVLTWENAAVYVHEQVQTEARNSFVEGITEQELDEVFLTSSVAAAVIRKKLEPKKCRKVEEFYLPLASADSLCRSISDSIENGSLSGARGGLLLDAVRKTRVVTDIASINGARLAVNLATSNNDLGEKLEGAALSIIESSFDIEQAKYNGLLEAFGRGSPLTGAKLFVGSIPTVLVATAFPMLDNEADQYFDML